MNQSVPDELISAYFDGEVSPEERSQVERLLESSPEFRQQLDDTSKLSALLHSFPREAAPPELAAYVQQKVAAAVVVPSTHKPLTDRSLRREWTAFGVGILATMASLMMFVRFNQPQLTSPLRAPVGSMVLMEEDSDSKLGKTVKNGTVAGTGWGENSPRSKTSTSMSDDKMPTSVSDESADTSISYSASLADAMTGKADATPMPIVPQVTTFWSDDFYGTVIPQSKSDFLSSLSNGDVIYPSRFADPSNTVAVVDFAVVDISRGIDEWKVLLQKRSVQQLDSTDAAPSKKFESRGSSQDPNGSARNSLSRSEELQVLFVQAPGDQIVGAIEEFHKNHPDLIWSPQLPIELPPNAALYESEGLASKKDLPTDARKQKLDAANDESKVVNVEAELAFGAFMARNGVTNSSAETQLSLASPVEDAKSKSADQTNLARRVKDAASVVNPSDSETLGRTSANNSLGDNSGQQSYFRVAAQNQALSFQRPSAATAPRQNSAVPLLANNSFQFANNGMSGGAPMSRSLNSVSSPEGRNSRPVKMLIVLKSGQPASPSSP